MKNGIELKLLSTETIEKADYNETVKRYECPCGKGKVIWSKEKPNGRGYGYQASYSDVFCLCDACKGKYDFEKIKGFAL